MGTTQDQQISDRFKEVRNASLTICSPLQPEDYIPQAALFCSPPKWHLAHTTWFFEQFVLRRFVTDYKDFGPQSSFLFNSYYNGVGERIDRSQRGLLTRPYLEEVLKYREHIDARMQELLSTNNSQEVASLLEIGLNHEQQHQELLYTDIKYLLHQNPLQPVYRSGASLVSDHNKNAGWVSRKEGVYSVGHSGAGFCFDNELERHSVFLNAFSISKAMVTNGDYLQFMLDGGYNNHELWHDEGWAWVRDNNIKHPLFWEYRDGSWYHFTLGGLLPLDQEAILSHVSHYEAFAFAQWKGMRLPTEAEWEIASGELDWGMRWEHTASPYVSYPGYKKPKGAVGEYNGKFMINQMVLRGGSNATPIGHSRSTYRNFFHPHLQWQFAGIRLAKDE